MLIAKSGIMKIRYYRFVVKKKEKKKRFVAGIEVLNVMPSSTFVLQAIFGGRT